MKKSLVMWDWDGTIINNHGSALQALKDVAQKYHLQPITKEDVQNVMGTYGGAFWTFHFGENFKEPYTYFINQFEQYNLSKIPFIFTGVLEALDYVKAKDIPQIVLSNMPQDMLNEESQRAGLKPYFVRLTGLGSSQIDRKPFVENVQRATQGISYDNLIMIGDGESDLLTAQNVGARMIYIGQKARTDYSYDYLVLSHTQILGCLKLLLEGDK